MLLEIFFEMNNGVCARSKLHCFRKWRGVSDLCGQAQVRRNVPWGSTCAGVNA